MFDVRVSTNRTAGPEVVWTAKTFKSAWDEFKNQIEESTNDEYIEIWLTDGDCVLNTFRKDELRGYQNHGTLYEVGANGEEIPVDFSKVQNTIYNR